MKAVKIIIPISPKSANVLATTFATFCYITFILFNINTKCPKNDQKSPKNPLESGSQLWCHAVMSLQFTHVPSFACRGGWRKSGADCSTVGLCCVTMTGQQICKGSLCIAGGRRYVAWDLWTQTSWQVMQREVTCW